MDVLGALGIGNMAQVSLYLNYFLLFLLVIIFLGMGAEGRHFLGMKLKKGGISLIVMNPAGGIQLKRLDYKGDYFESGKDAIFFGLDLLYSPDNAEKVAYNELLKQASYWADSKSPVLMGYDAVGFVANPALVAHLEEAKRYAEYETIKPIVERLQKILPDNMVKASFMKPFNVKALREYIRSSTASKQRISYEKGKISGMMQMTRPKGRENITKFVLPVGVILLLLVIFQSGLLQQWLGI